MANFSSCSDLSSNPTEAWEKMKPNATVMRFKTRSNPKHSVAKVMNTDTVIGKIGTYEFVHSKDNTVRTSHFMVYV